MAIYHHEIEEQIGGDCIFDFVAGVWTKADSDKDACLRGLARRKGWVAFRWMGRGSINLPKRSNKRIHKREVVGWERANRKEARSKPMLDFATRET